MLRDSEYEVPSQDSHDNQRAQYMNVEEVGSGELNGYEMMQPKSGTVEHPYAVTVKNPVYDDWMAALAALSFYELS